MSEAVIIALITAVVSISASMGATYLQSRKWREGEQPVQAASATAEITDTSLALVTAIRDEMRTSKERMQAEITALRGELEAVRKENAQMRITLVELEDVREWAERLVHQVQSLGAEPVKMRVRIPRTNE